MQLQQFNIEKNNIVKLRNQISNVGANHVVEGDSLELAAEVSFPDDDESSSSVL